jgi:GMP synthase-like glutamine amidotransferase
VLLVLQHAAHEEAGLIEEMADGRAVPLLTLRTFRGDPLPRTTDGLTAVVAMGGPMSVNDGLPWIAEEKRLLALAMAEGLPVLGVCLGAQLMAAALGAAVTRAPALEVGFGEVELTREAQGDRLFSAAGATLPVLHWHGENLALPEGAVRLAGTPLCPNQAFRWGERAWGLQFHLEATEEMLERWVEEEGKDPGGGLPLDLPALREGQRKLHARALFNGALVFAHFLDILRDTD